MHNSNSNKTKSKKIPLRLKLVLLWYKILERVYPKGALKMAVKFFFQSFRTSRTLSQKELQKSSTLTKIDINGNLVNVYQWGNGTKKALLVHGWSGYGLQYEHFIKMLLDKGYTVFSFDAVAHGRSEGSQTTVLEFIQTIEELLKIEKQVDVLIGHSLGGVAVSHFAFDERVDRLGIISSPSSSEVVMDTFQRKINASDDTVRGIEVYVQTHFGRSLASFFPSELFKIKQPTKPTFLIQDETDKEFPISSHYELRDLFRKHFPFISEGWGHTRLLENPDVIQFVSGFIDS